MWKAAVFAATVLVTVPAYAEDGRVFDRSSGKSWSGSMRDPDEREDRYSSDRAVDLYGNDGERTGSARVESDGRAFSNETGRGIGVWRPSR
jgi:hypothetical protein